VLIESSGWLTRTPAREPALSYRNLCYRSHRRQRPVGAPARRPRFLAQRHGGHAQRHGGHAQRYGGHAGSAGTRSPGCR